MSQRKSTTKKRTTSKSRAELRRELAEQLSAVLSNPECPVVLYNDIAEAITDISSDLGDAFWHSPEQIERDLNAHIAKEEKRKGGAQ